jgi:hypothetical protein
MKQAPIRQFVVIPFIVFSIAALAYVDRVWYVNLRYFANSARVGTPSPSLCNELFGNMRLGVVLICLALLSMIPIILRVKHVLRSPDPRIIKYAGAILIAAIVLEVLSLIVQLAFALRAVSSIGQNDMAKYSPFLRFEVFNTYDWVSLLVLVSLSAFCLPHEKLTKQNTASIMAFACAIGAMVFTFANSIWLRRYLADLYLLSSAAFLQQYLIHLARNVAPETPSEILSGNA